MIAATGIFAVVKRQTSCGSTLVITILVDLSEIAAADGTAFVLPTYDQAVRIVTQRGLSEQTRVGLLRRFGMQEFATLYQRIVFESAEELDALVSAMA